MLMDRNILFQFLSFKFQELFKSINYQYISFPIKIAENMVQEKTPYVSFIENISCIVK